jgi:quinol monooxygenase YgiN
MSQPTDPEQKSNNLSGVFVQWHCQSKDPSQSIVLFKQLRDVVTRKSLGTIMYQLFQDPSDPKRLEYIELYANTEAFLHKMAIPEFEPLIRKFEQTLSSSYGQVFHDQKPMDEKVKKIFDHLENFKIMDTTFGYCITPLANVQSTE